MLTPVGTPAPIQSAAGHYLRASCQFQSTTPLGGTTIRFNPGLTTSQSAPSGAIAWSLPYPATAGTYQMSFNAPAVWKNFKAELEVIDGSNFRINLWHLTGLNTGYVGGSTAPNASTPFAASYSAVTFFVEAGKDSTYCTIPVQMSSFCAGGNMTFDVDYTAGLKVTMTANGFVSSAFVGFYRTDTISGVQSVPDDIDLHYKPVLLGSPASDFPDTCFQSISPFIGSPGSPNQQAVVQIDPACVDPNGTYKIFIAYNDGQAWRSCQTQDLQLTSNVPVIAGDISYEITDGVSTFTTGCVTDIPPCKQLTVNVLMDLASYDAQLADNGVGGSMLDYFTEVKVAEQTAFAGAVTGPLTFASVDTSAGVQATYAYTPNVGSMYLVFAFVFTFPDRTDTVLVPVQLATVPYTMLTAPATFCAESNDPIEITLPDSVSGFLATQYDQPNQYVGAVGLSASGNTLTIDPATIPIGVSRCYEICTEDAPTTQPCMCDCDCITFQYTGQGCDDKNYIGEIKALGVLAADVKTLRVETNGGLNYTQLAGNTATISGVSDERFPVSFFLRGVLTMQNGCIYTIPSVNFELSPDGTGVEPCNDVKTEEVCQANCDCDDVPPDTSSCNNATSIQEVCTNGELTFLFDEQLSSPVDSDITECSLDGVTWGACALPYTEDEVHCRRTISFTDGCPTIQAMIVGRCSEDVTCANSASLTVDKTDALLTLTIVGSYGSATGSEKAYYSLDGGGTFSEYIGPVTLTGGETIRVYSVTTFTDGCPDVQTPILDATGVNPNNDGLVSYCNSAGEITGFALVVIESGSSTTIYYNPDMTERITVPDGGPCETFTTCATCP